MASVWRRRYQRAPCGVPLWGAALDAPLYGEGHDGSPAAVEAVKPRLRNVFLFFFKATQSTSQYKVSF